ncbi:syndecan domain protein, putative [Rhizoctonia solani AG-3 Rhs1AP]|uniref:Syndecan domain protein, putative n=2 Tax=Rhizoctonia solani AG-3 TaxID=1086053 RepID=A0A0A1UK72_9AGAM|nr:syndecan domain protein, putative [Rhizoctonia solani AG-3 Rhs1AP]KEP49584.1 putative syndecan domain protein [Rhizoctonia solani 123E]
MSDSIAATKPEGEITATGVTDPATTQTTNPASSPASKGKGKGKATAADDSMDIDEVDDEEEEDDDDDDDEDEDEEEVDEDEGTEDYSEIDPSVIQPDGGRSRRARAKVDYSSVEAHAKAGLKPGQEDDEE